MNTFKEHVVRSNSIIAAHAMLRALSQRHGLGRRKDLVAYLDLVCGDNEDAKLIARQGIDLIAEKDGGDLSALSDKAAAAYIAWLSEFVSRRAASGRVVNRDRGRTLLFELRKTSEA